MHVPTPSSFSRMSISTISTMLKRKNYMTTDKQVNRVAALLQYRYIFTWILHQIFIYSDKVILEAIIMTPFTQSALSYCMNELTNKCNIKLN